jgi:hypothetical protein
VTDDSGLEFCSNIVMPSLPHRVRCVGHDADRNVFLTIEVHDKASNNTVYLRSERRYAVPVSLLGTVSSVSSIRSFADSQLNAGSLLKNSGIKTTVLGYFTSGYGADLTGATDATAAVQNCLNAAGAGGVCKIDPGGIVKLIGDLTVPAQTTLDCGATFPDIYSLPGAGIRLDPTKSILLGGTSSTVRNCLIVPNGMTFPQADSAGFIGTAINTQGSTSIEIENVEILGFDACINGYGSSRPRYTRIYMDCNGVTNGGAFITGNEVDAGSVRDVKLQVIGTAASCPGRLRQGTGWFMHDSPSGGIFADNVVVQDFQVANYYIKNYNNFMGGRIWSDYASAAGCTIGTTKGFILDNSSDIHIDHLNLNGTQTGLVLQNFASSGYSTYIGDLFINGIGQDCVLINGGGHLTVDSIRTNTVASPLSCGRYAVNYNDSTSSSFIKINRGNLFYVNGGASPYIGTAYNTSPGVQLQLGTIVTDLPPGAAMVGGAAQPRPPTVASAATLALKPGQCAFLCTVSGSTTITAITGASSGDDIVLEFQGSITVSHTSTLHLSGNRDLSAVAGTLLHLRCASYNGTTVVCSEIGRGG